jgi:glycerol-3-phosphate dehydrogenase (NAD(P)+)
VNAGGWGTALAVLLANSGHAVQLWCRRSEQAAELTATRQNRTYLEGVALPPSLRATADRAAALVAADAVILAPISRAARETARRVADHLPVGTPVAHASKGFEPESHGRLSEAIADELGAAYQGRVAVVAGPTHAEEVARMLPTAAVVSCEDPATAAAFQGLLHGPTFRVYTSPDVVGVEVCAALKNVIALAIGGADGLGFGDNARAALITRALAEIGRLVGAEGGDARTVAGLAGLGDVVATCTSRHSRNRWAGEQLGRGRPLQEVLASTPQVVEGIPSTLAAHRLAQQLGVELPICQQVYQVIYEGAPVREALANLMGREATAEL